MTLMLATDPPRLAERHPCAVETTCQPPSSWVKDPWPAVIRSIWTRGVSLSLARRFEKGSGLAVEVPAGDGTSSTMLARVTQVQAHTDGFLLDVSFISELSEEEVGHVLDLSERGPAVFGAAVVTGVLFQTRLPDRTVLRWLVRRLELPGGWPLPEGKEMSFALAGVAPLSLTVTRCRSMGSYRVLDVKIPGGVSDEALAVLTG